MTQEQRTRLEGRLREERERVERALERLRGDSATSRQEQDGDLSAYPLHQADQGTDAQDPEEYGRCRDCDGEIPFERLDLVPWARDCDCAGPVPTPA
jgi:RNA polymerase-binding transcription factor DksA